MYPVKKAIQRARATVKNGNEDVLLVMLDPSGYLGPEKGDKFQLTNSRNKSRVNVHKKKGDLKNGSNGNDNHDSNNDRE